MSFLAIPFSLSLLFGRLFLYNSTVDGGPGLCIKRFILRLIERVFDNLKVLSSSSSVSGQIDTYGVCVQKSDRC